MAKAIREELIKQLAGGDFVSGQALGEQLGVSRAAISKHINALTDMGLDVFRITGKGYQLAQPLHLLNQQYISNQLSESGINTFVEVHSLIDSTNSYLMRRLPNQLKHGQVCIAEHQSAGRGRRGRQWVSPFASHIYMSMYWLLEEGMSAAMGLSVVTALAVSDAIKQLYNIDVQLKWPNDIYLDGVKLAGILIDLEGQTTEECHCVIGLGLNLVMPKQSVEQIDQPWTELQAHCDQPINRNELTVALIKALTIRLSAHHSNNLTMITEWQKLDLYFNQQVKIITGKNETIGICRGINHQGALMLEVNQQIKAVYGGEVSLRKVL
jgi:BirA family biotin operon repressor/biotin-[acetyl-CoA-carboxylase] ligase